VFRQRARRSCSAQELALARAICDRIAVAVFNAQLFDRVRRQGDDSRSCSTAVGDRLEP
jgi:GAF domain-containing protein